jgi:hypothetical protein
MDNKRIRVTELDFDQVKDNFKNFLKGQDQFQDYDFEGSGISVLLDILAYNTHYNAMYANLAMNEAFLDSASKRNNVVSHAKSLGYIPISAKCAQAVVNVVVLNPTNSPDTLTLPSYTQFLTSVDGVSYNFYSRNAVTIVPVDGSYVFTDVVITEGTPLRFQYIANIGTSFIIPNAGADLSTLTVRVQDTTSTSGYVVYSRGDDLTLVGPDDTVFFVKEVDNELYEIYFGDGITGRAVVPGNVVTLDYFISNKEAPNNAKAFSCSTNVGGGTVIVSTTSMAQGGSSIETIDSIKYNAPRNYAAQNRAVTAEDYKVILPTIYPNIESVNVWGGEEADPPQYGKVFISIKPKSGETLTTSTKEIIKNSILRRKNIVSISPEIVDADFLYVYITSSVYYNPLQTEKNTDTLKTLINNVINKYDNDDLRKFGGMFRFSKLSRLIDATDASITSNITNVKMAKVFSPEFNRKAKYNILFNNPIYNSGSAEEAVKSSPFFVTSTDQPVYIDDDGVGNLRLFYYTGTSTKVFINKTLGTVNYTTGKMVINDFVILSATNNQITIYCVPDSNDIVSVRNQIVAISQNSTRLNVIVDTVASGQFTGGTNYVFSSSHNYST